MKGQILGYNSQNGEGLIVGEDNQRYTFNDIDWKEEVPLMKGTAVDFLAEGNIAKEIYRRRAEFVERVGSKSKVTAGVLALLGLLFPFGIHKFYLGYIGTGIVMIVLSMTVVGLIITMPISLIEAIIYLCKSDEEFHETYVVNKRPWF